MKKNYFSVLSLAVLALSSQVNAQEYERMWGTYFGPEGTFATGIIQSNKIMFDSMMNMYVNTGLFGNSSNPASYYNQFVIGNGQPYIAMPFAINNSTALSISSSGIPVSFGYSYTSVTDQSREYLAAIDNQDNKIYIYNSNNTSSTVPTSGTWLQNNPISNTKNLLIKKSSSGSILWATYLPGNINDSCVRLDSAGNIYIKGLTSVQTLSTPGVFQENFDVIINQGNIRDNPFVAKLNANGQLVWASYLPSEVNNMIEFNGSLYMITNRNINQSLNTIATSGAQQTVVSPFSITKMNAANGQRIWGTYYGTDITSFYLLYDLDADENGVYLTGTDYNIAGSNFFATPGAFKTQVTGGSDLFLTKFTHSGNLVWSTYFGGNGSDENSFDKVINVHNGDIYITGSTNGSTDNIATPGSYQPAPENMNANTTNQFFAKFDASGNRVWSSYYGGSSVITPYLKGINITLKGNSLFLFGNTNSNTGFATEGAFMPTRNPTTGVSINGFFARFDNKQELSTSENNVSKDLVLYDNPNSGIFTIAGTLLKRQSLAFHILDASARQLATQKMSNAEKQTFDFSGKLSAGNYLIQITDGSGKTVKTFKMSVTQ